MAYVPGAVLIAALVAGCSAGTEGDASATDSKPGTLAVAAAPPGKYRTLPEACRAIPLATLKDLLPGAAQLPEAQQEKVYEGTPAGTFDTDRRVGCRWKSDAPDSSRSIAIDFERVVSYDPAVSDDDRAREVYAKKEEAADLPSASPADDAEKGSASPEGSPTGSGEAGGKGGADGKTGATPGPGATGSADDAAGATPDGGTGGDAGGDTAGGPAENLQPRVLDQLGDSAFLDDLLTRAGSTAQHRTVSVVFRTSNVIVTIEYTAQPALSTEVPDSKELQEKAQALGEKLVDGLSG
ncbi:DUF3558 domain-containing protein [Streptomyces sp. A0642]|uniref:DUF3558 domain-containing protein n=1 Tax=Streptomyces sp. A0642 TaxID=2563100 RepID=UPI0010A20D03|nr:DUF3558 domain-containing protein [Streptomyces sp. A0642]THA62930.1 DUF3558 domain-containing protein [Streptomyces sp. A0642]